MLSYFRNFIWGIIMAFGELLPGVGMQTVAIIVGLYDDLIGFLYGGTEFLRTLYEFVIGKVKKGDLFLMFKAIKWSFGLPMFAGLALTIVALSHTVSAVFESYPTQVAAVSFGIVIASAMIPYREITEKTWKELLVFLASFVAFFALFSLTLNKEGGDPSVLTFFGGGLLASVAGFFPGISISLALLLMGLYRPLFATIESITSKDPTLYSFSALLLFLTGLAIGMLICVRVLTILIQKYKSLFLAFIVGLILASLKVVWPFRTSVVEGVSNPILPWEVPLPVFTQQLIFITIAFISVSMLRKLAENKGTLASSFGKAERIVVKN